VAGDIESIREWIEDGVNGLLTDPANPADLAAAVSRLLSDPGLREQAAAHNARLIAERALHPMVMQQAEAFYHRLVG
jgi:glycosyltransferase involved in cell wall biosynthesis